MVRYRRFNNHESKDFNKMMGKKMICSKGIKILKNPWLLGKWLLQGEKSKILSDKTYVKLQYYFSIKRKLSLDYPETFNEKLQWLKLHDRNPLYTSLVDKYEVRKYVFQMIGQEYLIPLLGVWNSFDEIDFNKLPDQFVLKCTHDSGGVYLCRDKKSVDYNKLNKFFKYHLKKNYYYYYGREWPYKNVRPRIIAEKFLDVESGQQINDYKFMVFNGKVKCEFVCTDRGKPNESLKVTFFDTHWKRLPFERHYPQDLKEIRKPENFDKMVELAEKLAGNIPFVRVDFYEVKGKVYFGELTFYPGSGFEEFTPQEWDKKLGSWIQLSGK